MTDTNYQCNTFANNSSVGKVRCIIVYNENELLENILSIKNIKKTPSYTLFHIST